MHSASTFISIISVKNNLYAVPAVILTEQLAKHTEHLGPAHLISKLLPGTGIQRSLTRYIPKMTARTTSLIAIR